MDIPCPKCREPWDMDSIHDAIDEQHPNHRDACSDAGVFNQGRYEQLYYNPMKARFFAEGCVALGGSPCTPVPGSDTLSMIYAELGDDLDGLACDLEDFADLL